MKVSTEQIEKLYKFTRDHFVEHYDLQTELVDHLANGIETRWKENPKLSFEDALNLEFKEFGVIGFNDVIERHDFAMTKRYFKLILRFMREYFELPKIIGTITAILAVFYVIHYVVLDMEWISMGLFFLILIYFSIQMWNSRRAYRKQKQETKKRWKLKEMIFSTGIGGLYMLNVFQIVLHLDFFLVNHIIAQFLAAVLLVFMTLFTYISTNVLPEKAEELLREVYPAYQLSE